jgi:LacI family asc operon transcriptional repressor
MATMLDVSRKAGVSKSTVSRVLNGTAKISQATRDAVFKAIEELNYRPNVLAQTLSRKASNTIGLIIPRGASASYALATLIEQAQEMVDQQGKFLAIAQVNDQPNGGVDTIRAMLDRRCDAILYYNNSFFDHYNIKGGELSALIDELPIPLVVVNCHLEKHPHHCIWVDHTQTGYIQTKYLIEQGHTRIAYIAGPLTQRTAQLRLQGYQNALREAGIALDPLLLVEGDRQCSGGYSACCQLLQRTRDFTALACFNDQTVIGAMKALNEHQVRMPDEVSLIGVDNDNVDDYLVPSITTVALPLHQLVDHSIKLLFAHLNGTETPSFNPADFSGELVIRQSVRALK